MNVFNIERTFKQKKERGWPEIFVAVDIHDTMFPGTFTKYNEGKELYPYAKEVLQWMTKRMDIILILWSSSHKGPMEDVWNWCFAQDIYFNYMNQNPMCLNSDLCDFNKKFYMNVILDDKAGFEGEIDWLTIKQELQRIGEW